MDSSSEIGARALAKRIRKFWAERGVKIDVRVIAQPSTDNLSTPYIVRSNLTAVAPLTFAATEIKTPRDRGVIRATA